MSRSIKFRKHCFQGQMKTWTDSNCFQCPILSEYSGSHLSKRYIFDGNRLKKKISICPLAFMEYSLLNDYYDFSIITFPFYTHNLRGPSWGQNNSAVFKLVVFSEQRGTRLCITSSFKSKSRSCITQLYRTTEVFVIIGGQIWKKKILPSVYRIVETLKFCFFFFRK